MNITIFGWAIVVVSLTGGIVFLLDKQYTLGIVTLLVGTILSYIGFKDKFVKSREDGQ